jgi:hypothetical protein
MRTFSEAWDHPRMPSGLLAASCPAGAAANVIVTALRRGLWTCDRQRKRDADKGEERGENGEAHCVLARVRWWGMAAGLTAVQGAGLYLLLFDALIAVLVSAPRATQDKPLLQANCIST